MRTLGKRGLRVARLGAGLVVVVGTAFFVSSASSARIHHHANSKKVVVLDGHICTKTATAHHSKISGHSTHGKPAVLCGVSGNDTLKATGSGMVFLIAGPGSDTLIASSSPGAQDILIGGSGPDTFVAGNQGDDVIQTGPGDTIQCTPGATTTIAGDDQGDNENGDCGDSNVVNATEEWQGSVTAVTSNSLTVQWSDHNDAAQAWLDANSDPSSVTFDTTSAAISGTPTMGGDVQVESNPSSPTLAGSTLVAVSVEADGSGGASCTGTLTGPVEGDLTVTTGSCTLNGADVQGNVSVGPGVTIVVQNSTIEGDFATAGAASVSVSGSNLQGDVTIEGTTGSVTLDTSSIEGDLNCDANASTPSGSGNTVQGDAGGQCASLGSGSGGDDNSQ